MIKEATIAALARMIDVLAIGSMDDSHETDADKLRDGADELEAWAKRIIAIDKDSEPLGELADYLASRANAARVTADQIGDDDYNDQN